MRSLSLSISGFLALEGGRTAGRSRGLAAGLRAGLGRLAALERFDHLHGRGGVEILVEIVADPDHRGIDAGAEAFHLGQRERAVRGALAEPDAKLLLAGMNHMVRTAQL